MKSLLKDTKSPVPAAKADRMDPCVAPPQGEEAQCCAKVSKTVAGCHD